MSPVLLDDWYQLTWHRHNELTLASVWEYARYNYFHFNPRIGDVLLMLVNGPPVIHLIATPLVQVALLWVVFAVAFGRWPRPTTRDLQLLLFIQVAIWIAVPAPGVMYFYRPFTTNYLWAFTTTLALFAPYRIALTRGDDRARPWLTPVMAVVGWLAGMSNEHTGPTAMVAMAIFVGYAWRKRRLRVWMIAGAVGLYLGYPMLFLAPGQTERYAGVATRNTPVVVLAERGLRGSFDIIVAFVGEVQLATNLALVAFLAYLGAIRRRAERIPTLPPRVLAAIALPVVAAGSIVVTLFVSPAVGERLFFASGVLVVIGLVVVADVAFAERAARRLVVGICIVVFGYHAFRFVYVYAVGGRANRERMAILAAAPDGTTPTVPPYKMWKRTRWWWGDDFRYSSLREYVGNEVYDVDGIEMDRHTRWSEPSPGERFVATRVYEPPLPPGVEATIAPLRYIPTYWEWDLVQLRRAIAFDGLGEWNGHELVRYTVDVAGSTFVDPKRRPLRALEWTPTSLGFVDGGRLDNDRGQPFIRVWDVSVPAGHIDTYVFGCGTTTAVETVPDTKYQLGPMVPVPITCRGMYQAVMCTPTVCWLAGRYWK